MNYTCFTCGEQVSFDEVTQRIRCPYCGAKVLFKEKSEIVKTVKAK